MLPILTPYLEIDRTKKIAQVIPCDAAVEINDLVYLAGGEVKQASNSSALTMPVIGVVEEKLTSTSCRVVSSGWMDCPGVVAGMLYYAGVSLGSFTNIEPISPALKQVVFVAQTNSTILVACDLTFA
ncbi:MAG: hypothetical protein KJ760_19135 [Proteobacteria bacterium]|nr:hypothetical protein [Pseudomonadota bacterium]